MDITILGYKLNLELLILIGVIYLILVGHTVCGCCNMRGIMEGLSSMTSTDSTNNDSTSTSEEDKKAALMKKAQEGFVGANTNYGESSQYTLGDYSKVDTSSWGQPTLTVSSGKSQSKAVKQFLNRAEQPVPLPEGELSMFANTPFKPECCPNTYSNSSGCACMTGKQYNYLITRAGNNVPYSEY